MIKHVCDTLVVMEDCDIKDVLEQTNSNPTGKPAGVPAERVVSIPEALSARSLRVGQTVP